MKKITLSLTAFFLCFAAHSQVIFSEDFDGIGGPTAGGAGTYSFPTGWLIRNVDNLTPAANVAYVNEAWERREDFSFNVSDSAAFSTSWYAPAGMSNDWMWTPPFYVPSAQTFLSWNAIAYDGLYQDGYEVRVMTQSSTPSGPTGGTGVIGNQLTSSTVIFSTAAEASSWTAHQVSLGAFSGQTVWIGFRNTSNDKFLLLIDDVQAEVQNDNDLQVVAGSVSHGEYTFAPATQQTTSQNFQLQGSLMNSGLQPATNVMLGCDVFVDGTFLTVVQSAATATLASGATLAATIPYAPTIDGIYTFKFYPVFTETDQEPANDTVTDPIGLVVTPSVMRRDNGNIVGSLGIGTGTGGFIGQTFRFEMAVNIQSIDAYLNLGYPGKQLKAAIYSTDGSGVPTTYLAGTDTLTYPDDSARLYTMPMYGGTLTLPAGEYAFLQVEIDSTLALAQTSAVFTPNTAYVNWPSNPNGPAFTPIETFGAQFSKSFMIYPHFDVCFGMSGGSLAGTTQAGCGLNDGEAQLTLTPGYSVIWDDSTTNATNSSLAAGMHVYTMSNGTCTFTDSVLITNPNAPTASVLATTDALCFGQNGSIEPDIQGGQSPYTIIWSDGSMATTLTAPAGTYTATITDANNCQAQIGNTTIGQPAALTAGGSATDETCASCDDGTASVTPTGGTAPYTINWSNGINGSPISGLAPGTYTATIIDANGCQTTYDATINAFVGLNELADYGIVVYPNPVVDYLAIEAKKGNVMRVSLMDASGRIIQELTKSSNTFTVDMRHLAKGTYQVVIRTTNGTIISAVAKQ